MNYSIRKGTPRDIPATLNLIKELAEYEKAPKEVTVTIEEMERDAFGKDPVFYFFVAESDGMVVGTAIYFIKYSTWKGKCVFLEDIVVNEKYRGRGIGKGLFEAVIKVSAQMQVKRMEWQVLDWNEPAIHFYEKFNSLIDPTWVNCKLNEAQLQAYQFDSDLPQL